ncbi:MAG: energy transducer TonB [Xanthomonadales bacterium]|jgi:hypothetical protein|nr:energy transducer TonB [Xanthomonadales bacterium]
MKKSTSLGTFICSLALFSVSAGAEESESFIFLPGDQLGAYWTIEKKVAPHYPKRALQKGEQGCATVSYVIEPDGTTSNHNVVVFTSDFFKAPSVSAAEDFLYKPSEENVDKVSVITINTFTYQISNGPSADEEVRQKIKGFCESKALEALGAPAREAEVE